MSLRWRLALTSGLLTLAALVALLVGSGWLLERERLRALDEELSVQARVVLDDVLSGSRDELSPATADALRTATGTSGAWAYDDGQLLLGDGVDAPEPLDASFLETTTTSRFSSVNGWRVASLRAQNIAVQVGRPLEPLARINNAYWQVNGAVALGAALIAGVLTIVAVNRVTEPLERLARRVTTLESDAPIPALGLRDEVGALARALETSLHDLRATRARETRFLADAAHELRTPVTALLADLEHHAARARTPEADHAVLERATRTARHLRDLASNLLTLSHTERGLELRPVDAFEIASSVVDRLASLAARKALEISLDGAPATVRGDAVALERALENLVGNAIKYTDAGEVRVNVGHDDKHVTLEVTDTGPGMPPELLETIFEPFERGDTRREGSGLGLAVVKGVMDAHGGAVALETKPEGGLRAVLSLPRAD
jgi:signal transduction histidine kinase